MYLFGTVHVGTRALYPLSPQVEEAFAASHALALEANPLDQQEVAAAMEYAMYKPPDDLSKHVSPKLFERVKVLSPRVGLPVEYARRMKPHMLAMTLAMMEIQRLGYDAGLGLDIHFAQRATQSGMPILELESMEGQMKLFDELPADLQEGMLEMAVDTIEDGSVEQEMDALLAAWANGDSNGIHDTVLRETEGLPEPVAQELQAAIYDRRNEAMAERNSGLPRRQRSGVRRRRCRAPDRRAAEFPSCSSAAASPFAGFDRHCLTAQDAEEHQSETAVQPTVLHVGATTRRTSRIRSEHGLAFLSVLRVLCGK